MTKEGPERILELLRTYSENDKELSNFLESIFHKELDGIHFWNKVYENELNKYMKSWDGNDED